MLLFLAGFQSCHGIGQVTSPIVFENALKGQVIPSSLVLINSDPSAKSFDLRSEGAIAGWTAFYNLNDDKTPVARVEIPARSRLAVNVKFTIPADAPNKTYKGLIVVSSIDESAPKESGVSVGEMVARDVSITVSGKQILKLSSNLIVPKFDLDKDEPLKMKIFIMNEGNVAVKPDVRLTISKDGIQKYNAIIPYPADEPEIGAYSSKELDFAEWLTYGQERGIYKADVGILVQGQTMKEDSFAFTLDSHNSNIFLAALLKIGGGDIGKAWLIIGSAILAAGLALTYLFKFGGKRFNFFKAKK